LAVVVLVIKTVMEMFKVVVVVEVDLFEVLNLSSKEKL
jgi:hypothetical protein